MALCLLFPFPASGADAARLTTELVDLRLVRHRIILDRGEVRFLFTDVRGQDGKPVSVLGIGSPGLTVGPVSLTGLLREIRNPLGYRPASGILWEASGLGLDSGFSPAARGISLSILSGRLTVYGLLHRSCPSAGVLFSAASEACGKLWWEASLSASDPAARGVGEEWYPAVQGFPGGRLVHAAGRMSWGWHTCTVALSGAGSGGELSEPGCFARAAIRLRGERGEAFLTGGVCSEAYLDPESRAADWARSAGAAFLWNSAGAWQGEAEYLWKSAPPRGRPVGFLEAGEAMACELQGEWQRGSRFDFKAEAAARLSRHHRADGSVDPEASIDLSVEPRFAEHALSLAASLGWDPGGVTGELRCRWDYSPQAAEGGFLECRTCVGGATELSCGVQLRVGKGLLEGEVTLTPRGAESRMRWETAAGSEGKNPAPAKRFATGNGFTPGPGAAWPSRSRSSAR